MQVNFDSKLWSLRAQVIALRRPSDFDRLFPPVDELPFLTLEPSDISNIFLPRWKPGQGVNFHFQE